MKKADVYYNGWGESWHLATLSENAGHLQFEYTTQALSQGLELSPLHMRLRVAAYADFPAHQLRLPGLIFDALHVGSDMQKTDPVLGRRGIDAEGGSVLDRLTLIADRALGALTFLPAGSGDSPPSDGQAPAMGVPADTAECGEDRQLLRQLAMQSRSTRGGGSRVLVYYNPCTSQMRTQAFTGGKPWLVKLRSGEAHAEACTIAHFYAQLARECGLEIGETRCFHMDGELSGYGMERFDMNGDMRVHVHTLAGLLHADTGLPCSVDYLTFLRATRYLTKDEQQVQKAYERIVFNVLFNHRDDHPKNISFLLTHERRWVLAPVHDLTFNAGPNGFHRMDVLGEARCITRKHLLGLAIQGGLDEQWASRTLERLLTVSVSFAARLAQHPVRSATQILMTQTIAENAKLLA